MHAHMMDLAEMMDDGVSASRKAPHKAHQGVLTEIKRNRVDTCTFECQDSYNFNSTSSIERTKPGKRAYITDIGRHGTRVRSFKKHLGVDEVDKLDDGRKYATLDPRIINRPRANDTDKQKIREGMLYKTSRGKVTSNLIRGQHEHRQHRRFQLTEHSLEYSQLLQRVKVRKQFPLTSIIDIVYNEKENPIAFILQFEKSEILLEAHDKLDCQIWIKDIQEAWRKWPKPVRTSTVAKSPIAESPTEEQGFIKTGEDLDIKNTKPTVGEGMSPLPLSLPNEAHPHEYLHRESDTAERSFRLHASLPRIAIREKFGLIPRIHSFKAAKLQEKLDEGGDLGALHNLDFAMIKYPRKRKQNSLPHERVFTMDYDNHLIMWRQTEHSKFNQLHTLSTQDIVEIRKGQNSDGFDRYPYPEVEEQSFSILVEGEIQAMPSGNKYAVLQSFDLVCDSHEERELWCRALKNLISPKRHLNMFSSRFEFIDPTILWLKSHWTILSEGKSEIKEDAAVLFGQSIMPHKHTDLLKSYINVAHQYDLRESSYHGSSLHWDNYILLYNMMCGIDNFNCLLFQIYHQYAKDFPNLGMTVEEFKKFLIEQQHWSAGDATDERCNQLMNRHDHCHKAFKLYQAEKKAEQFHIILRLFSYAGFISFLRSVDNGVIHRKHEDVYQDMDQPLSHYFINSSHNTYLEGHQFTGRSTTDAYVRALLQGCRCLELDCWNGPNGEPKITHGNTLVSELSLEEVARTINEYAFCVSDYPVILSLENHCNKAQQARMAAIFQEVFGNKLIQKNLVEEQSLDRLPSPNEMKGKIILKGRKKSQEERVPYEGKGTRIPQQLQRTFIVKKLFKPSPESQASQENLDITKNGNTLESESDHSDEQDNITIKSDKTGSDEEYKPEDEEEQNNLHEDLSKLIVYCQATHIKPWSWVEQQQTSVCNMFSFNENVALSKCKESPKEMLACTERQFVRTYPTGSRIESSNYDPIPLWNHGIQMVALNVQTPGPHMYLNQGKFRQNGGCGYILKPEIMRDLDKNATAYAPNMTRPHEAVTPVNLEITLLSGQNFIIPNKTTSTMEILYQTYGIPHDCEQLKYNSSSDYTNPLWPQFSEAVQLKKTILMPELCLVLFAVNISVHRKLKAGTKQVLLGQNVFPLTSLKPGIHFIPLRKPGGDPVSHIGIFVEIKLSYGQASDEVHQQNIEASISSPDLFDTQQTKESLEDKTNSVENSEWNDKKLQSNHNGNKVYHKSPKLLHQQAFVVADVHCNTTTSSDC